MKTFHRLIAITLGLLIALAGSAAVVASPRALELRGAARSASPIVAAPAQQAACTKMQATSDVVWLETDEAGEATDVPVDVYPSGTLAISAAFDYSCTPRGSTIVTVFALDGEVVFSDKAPQKASTRPGSYGYTLARTDGEPMPDGEWEVGFFNNKVALTSGTITVGGDEPVEGEDVTVMGTVKDAKTKKPIKGALVIVLNEGIDAETFVDDPQDADVYASATTNARGEFVLDTPVDREGEHTWIIAAKGYKPILEDGVVLGADAPDPVELNITLSK